MLTEQSYRTPQQKKPLIEIKKTDGEKAAHNPPASMFSNDLVEMMANLEVKE